MMRNTREMRANEFTRHPLNYHSSVFALTIHLLYLQCNQSMGQCFDAACINLSVQK